MNIRIIMQGIVKVLLGANNLLNSQVKYFYLNFSISTFLLHQMKREQESKRGWHTLLICQENSCFKVSQAGDAFYS